MEVLIEELEKLRLSNKLIIVEGKKDKEALKKFGIKNVITLKEPLYKICEEITDEKVIILTDLDKEGKRLYSKLKENLERNGIKIDDGFRLFLFKETKLRQIEGLYTYFLSLKNATPVKTKASRTK
jgi:5S rRNA maturation endonuclease (ribonuclease M5)